MYKLVILSLAVAAVSAGYLGGPAVATYGAAPLAYAAPVHAVAPVATSYANTYKAPPARLAYAAAPAYASYAAPAYASYAAPAVVKAVSPLAYAAPVHAVAPVATSYANTYKAPPARLAYAAAPAYASYAAPAVVKAVSPLTYAAPAYASYAAPAYIH